MEISVWVWAPVSNVLSLNASEPLRRRQTTDPDGALGATFEFLSKKIANSLSEQDVLSSRHDPRRGFPERGGEKMNQIKSVK